MGRSLLVVLVISVLTPGIALAETWVVLPDSTGDAPTIQAGIDSASAGDTVLVMAGTYYECGIVIKEGVYLTSETGTADCVTIDAQGQGRILSCNWCDSTTTIVGFTIANGRKIHNRGGGMYCSASDLRMTNCNFHNNRCDSLGGAIYILYHSPVFTNCHFTSNWTSPNLSFSGGGAIYAIDASPIFAGCEFSDNEDTFAGKGGALWFVDGGNPLISGCTFTDNSGGHGGAVACDDCGLTVIGCTFEGNHATEGGALLQRGDSTLTVTDCEFAGNSAAYAGGAFNTEVADVVLSDCRFYDNSAGNSGGGGNVAYGTSVTASNCVFAGNRVTNMGTGRLGGAVAIWMNCYAELSSCTIYGNSADYGGGGLAIGGNSTGALDRCIIAYSELGEALYWNETGAEPVLTCCDLYGNAGGDWVGAIADQYGIDGNICDDPLFCDRSRYDLYLAAASPCLDADTCGVIGLYGLGCPVHRLTLDSVTDTPDDYGGYVDVSWYRDGYDGATGDTVIDYYTLWRRVDAPECPPAGARRQLLGVGDPPGTWEFIDSVAATGQAQYTTTCPTVVDSSEAGKGWSVFFVKAHCPSPALEFDTPPDSGYSVVNLSDWTDVTTVTLGNADYGEGFVWVDFDNDDDLDIFITNRFDADRLYRNDDLTAGGFVDVTPAILADAGNCRAPAWGDYDNDGDLDLYVCKRLDPNKLYRNDGGGSFTDVSSSPLDDSGIAETATWIDYDNDGDVDLYLLNWGANKLFRNDGGGSFTDVTSGPLGNSAHGTSEAWADYDNDGDMDVYVANDGDTNRLLENQGGGVFVDVTTPVLETPTNSLGAAWGDYDNDGDMDLYVTGEGPNRLLRNDGSGFTDVTSAPLDDDSAGRTGAWGDFDLDGDLDLYLVNDNYANKLFRNLGGGSFVRADSGQCPLADRGVGYCTAWGDYDKDGDPDLFVANDGSNKLFRNGVDSTLHWLDVRLVGDISNSYGVGARVRIVAGGSAQIREITGSVGYHSQGPLAAMFGLGTLTTVDTVEIRWPVGVTQTLTGIACDQSLEVTEAVSGLPRDPQIPTVFRLYASRPNPFSSVSSIRYDLPEQVQADLRVYDVSGRLVRTLVDRRLTDPGRHTAYWNGWNAEGRPVAPGIYFYSLSAGDWSGIQRVVLLK
jgi:hypothetical protein